jgi:hypothetical protein
VDNARHRRGALRQDDGVSQLPSPSAARLSRARWLDTRLVLGVLLVLVSVAVGAKVVAEADDTVPVWALARDVAPQTVLTPDDLTRIDVRLGEAGEQYVAARGAVPEGYVVTRELRRDELLPSGALARAGEASLRRVVVEVDSATTAGLDRGSVVDVYVVPEAGAGHEQPPAERVLEGVAVADEPDEDGGIRATSGTRGIVLLVPGEAVGDLLTATARGRTSLVQRPRTSASADNWRGDATTRR